MNARSERPLRPASVSSVPSTGRPSAPGKQPPSRFSAATSSGVSSYMSISSPMTPFSFSTSASSKRERKNMSASTSAARGRWVSSTRV